MLEQKRNMFLKEMGLMEKLATNKASKTINFMEKYMRYRRDVENADEG